MAKASREARAVGAAVMDAAREADAAPVAVSSEAPVIPESAEVRRQQQRRTAGHFILPGPDDGPELWPSSFDVTTDEGKVRAANALLQANVQVSLEQPGIIALHDYLIMPDSMEDEETGEISEYVSLILFDKDGRTLKTTGAVVMQRLSKWLDLWPDGEWRNLEVAVVVLPSREHKAQTYHDARVRWIGPKTTALPNGNVP